MSIHNSFTGILIFHRACTVHYVHIIKPLCNTELLNCCQFAPTKIVGIAPLEIISETLRANVVNFPLATAEHPLQTSMFKYVAVLALFDPRHFKQHLLCAAEQQLQQSVHAPEFLLSPDSPLSLSPFLPEKAEITIARSVGPCAAY